MKKISLLAGVVAAPLCLFAAGAGTDAAIPSSPIVVEINGNKVPLSEVEKKDPTAFFQARNTYYEAQRKAIADFTDQYLLEEQAKKENLTVDQLLEKHVNSQIAKDPSEEALHVYYEGVDTTEPYDAVKGKILEALKERRIAKAKTAYLQSLRSTSTVTFRLAPPRVEIPLRDTPIRGESTARVTLVEYADYECPYCQQIQPTLDKLEAQYKGKLAVAYKDMPLPMHASAEKAAEATHCAEAQGKYWEYHDRLFATKQLDISGLKESARALKLDGASFDKCLDSGAKAPAIKVDLAEAQTLGIQGTPTFFINGRYMTGALTYDKLREVVDEELGEPPAPQLAKR